MALWHKRKDRLDRLDIGFKGATDSSNFFRVSYAFSPLLPCLQSARCFSSHAKAAHPAKTAEIIRTKDRKRRHGTFFSGGVILFTSAMLHFVSVGCPPLPLKGTQNTSRDRETPYTLIPPSIQKKVLVAFFIRQRYSDMDVKDGGRK